MLAGKASHYPGHEITTFGEIEAFGVCGVEPGTTRTLSQEKVKLVPVNEEFKFTSQV